MANECLITKLKGVVDNDNLVRFGELKTFVGMLPNIQSTIYIRWNTTGVKTIRSISPNILLTMDGENWGTSVDINVTELGDTNYTFDIKSTTEDGGYIGISDKYNFLYCEGKQFNGTQNVAIPIIPDKDGLIYTKVGLLFQYCILDINMVDYPNVQDYTRIMGALADKYYVPSQLFPNMYYDRAKAPSDMVYGDLLYVYFPIISQLVDWLEDCAENYTIYNGYIRIVARKDSWGDKVGLDSPQLSPYKSRICNALVTLIPKVVNLVQILGITYTYTGNKLYADGVEVTWE